MKYNAFLSYNHTQDTDLGTSLEKALEKFAKPTFKRRALEIFRDANDLPLASDLGDKIRVGLEGSDYFICMANKRYAQSKWCQREVEYWLEHKTIEKFIIVLTEGDILYNEDTNDFDWDVTTALPKSLSGAFKGEPFYVDFRDLDPEEELHLDNPKFRSRLVLLAATLHGKSVGAMESEAAIQHKRTMRIRNAAIGILSMLLIIAIGTSFFAVHKKNEALLSTYIANSQAQLNEDPTISLRLAEEAFHFAKKKNFSTIGAKEQLIKVFYSGYGFYQDLSVDMPDVDKQESNKYENTNNPLYNDVLRITDSIGTTIKNDVYVSNQSDLYINERTRSAIYVLSSLTIEHSKIYFINLGVYGYTITESNIILPGFNLYTGYVQDVDISKDGTNTLLGAANGKTALIENNGYKYMSNRNKFKDRALYKSTDDFPVRYVSFIMNDEFIAVASFDSKYENGIRKDKEKTMYYYKKLPFPYIEIVNSENDYDNLSLDGNFFMEPADSEAEYSFYKAQALKTTEHDIIAEFPEGKGMRLTNISSPDKAFFASYQGVFNAHNDLLIAFSIDTIDNPAITLCFSLDSKFVKVSYMDGVQRIFSLDPDFIINRFNDKVMGLVAPLSDADKQRFFISD
ncbi:TIR domain-containing protein [Algibacter amylolyticus]|uniref:TIR domain-containing protein n=1 Tax=Algibacter amylolyticus TaxID=1608400 RepID=A0A5M7B886_9FLAO|nr:toll/interleukin-1 receptor domain-containing protein [Algibacter amylolyticus]KAA5824467.1 TIR domain-containing protein [Algibacter amylolyticus]MBB5269473.1 hypothetical protein [Algibacter amylolyticus]TSJ75240.1 TIR domain-containing protein [Algibacter amylolyticus]